MGLYKNKLEELAKRNQSLVETRRLPEMGIPIYIFEDENDEQFPRFGWSSDACKRRLGELWSEKERDLREQEDYGARTDDEMIYAWRFDLQRRVQSPLVNLAELESMRSKDALSWVFYRPDGSELAVYTHTERESECLTVVQGLQEVLQGSQITCVDVKESTLVLGLADGSVKVVTCNSHGSILQSYTVALQSGSILDLFAGFLPEYLVCFATDEGLLCTEISTGHTTKLLDVPEAPPHSVSIDFPRVSVHNSTNLWSCSDLLTAGLIPIAAPLRPEEQILYAVPCAHSLLLETNQRYLSLDTAATILHKTDHGLPARAHTAASSHQLFVAEQHLYATSLTMYGRCSRDREPKWFSLGYSDIRAKYNITKVLRLALLTTNLALLADDGSIHSFTIQH